MENYPSPGSLKFLDAWELNDYTLDKSEYTWLAETAGRLGIRSVLEFGPGSSTFAFLEHGCAIWSFENSDEWLEKSRETFRAFSSVQLMGYEVAADLDIPSIGFKQFDCAFVDGPNGLYYFKHHARICSLDLARTKTDLIFLHDSNRPKERRSIEYMEDKGWRVAESCPVSRRGFILLKRDPAWSPGPHIS